jgi:hypothetical protein
MSKTLVDIFGDLTFWKLTISTSIFLNINFVSIEETANGRDVALKQRFSFQTSIETFLIEANHRGLQSGQQVYVHVVGLGLGVWMFDPKIQSELYLQAFQNVLDQIDLSQISDVDFSWIEQPTGSSKFFSGKKFDGKNRPRIW